MNGIDLNTFIAKELNKEQQEAVLHTNGPLLVIAGAGSGKTRVITTRITRLLLQEKVDPITLVALTFTNKAATEMKERIRSFLPTGHGIPFIGTFHSYCLFLLKTNAHLLPAKNFSILDEDDKKALLTQLLKKSVLYKQYTAQALSHVISTAKNSICSSKTSLLSLIQDGQLYEIVQAYEKEKRTSNCFDFDDLLIEAIKLFENHTFKNNFQNQVRHILVDEYQDTNMVQHTLLKHMALNDDNEVTVDSLCAVGDEDQSIYSWRGATVDNIIHFKNDFRNTKLIKIEQNYRSKQPILTIANTVIKNNRNRNEKKLWSDRDGRDCVRILRCLSGYQEADLIARYCATLFKHNKKASIALLYRTHVQSRTLEEALLKHSVPYTIVGGIRFYERKEIKDLLAFLRLVHNPFDRVAFSRVINTPSRGLGEKFLEQFMILWDTEPFFNFKEVMQKIIDLVSTSKKEVLQEFLNLFTGKTPESSVVKVLSDYITRVDYILYVKKTYEKGEAEERLAHIKELLNAAHFFAQQGKVSVDEFLAEVSLLQEKPAEDAEQNVVTLMTLHAAKGLEFDNIVLSGVEENLFPSPRSIINDAQLEEERRLLYVGITRARNRLLITYARYRQTYGSMEEVSPSRFIHEIPKNQVLMDDACAWQVYQINSFFSAWIGFAPVNNEIYTFQSSPKMPPHKPLVKPIEPAKQTTPFVLDMPYPGSTSTTDNNSEQKTDFIFKPHQTVKHPTFGLGVVKAIEKRADTTFITAHFAAGTKKIDAKFLRNV